MLARAHTRSASLSPRQPARSRAQTTLDGLIISVLLWLLMLAAAVIGLVAAGLLDASAIIGDEALRGRLLGFADASAATRTLIAAGSGGLGLLCGYLALRRWTSTSATAMDRAGYHLVSADDDGILLVNRAGIERVAEGAGIRARGVMEIDACAAGKPQGPISLRITAQLVPGSDLHAAGNEIKRSARQAVERLTGVDVADVAVQVGLVDTDVFQRGLVQ